MRVFYVDEDLVTASKRAYYVKMDNVNVPDELKGYKMMEASSPQDLLNCAKEYYGLEDRPNINVQLWSNQMYSGVRLDTLEEIPKGCEFIWVRVLLNNKE
jgi:hypothetical protein